MQELDENGFIFLDDKRRPFLCAMWGSAPWLFYWHPDQHWVSLRQVNQTDIFLLPHNLTEDEQLPYRKLNEAFMKGEKLSEAEEMLLWMGRTPSPLGH